uniref:Thiol reductase thioredoxin n=2 Tax=Litorilinea aerophila TaxID=1204385 RepID=A0A540VHL4_9CHLR
MGRLWKRLARRPAVQEAPPAEPSTRPPEPRILTDADFAAALAGEERLLVVDFWAEWCQPCTIMAAYVDFLAADFGQQLAVAALDVDENPETPARYQVMGLPTLLFFRRGVEVHRQVGLCDYAELKERVAHLLADTDTERTDA